jgi:hypothetical protein
MKSYIKFNNRGFWVNDSIMQFVLGYLYCFLKDDKYFKTKVDFLDLIHENSMGTYASFMHLKIDMHLNEIERKKFCLKILSIVFTLNNGENKEVHLNELCNYQDYKSIEYYLPKSMDREMQGRRIKILSFQ